MSDNSPSDARPTPPAPESGCRARVLVVDDEPIIGRAVRRMLAPEHEVVALTSAREALERIGRGERFDVILCDLNMPDMTGTDFRDALATVAPEKAERMILLTGGTFTQDAEAFLARVGNPRIEKPFDGEALRGLVHSLMRS